jgi:hypothetical protein
MEAAQTDDINEEASPFKRLSRGDDMTPHRNPAFRKASVRERK